MKKYEFDFKVMLKRKTDLCVDGFSFYLYILRRVVQSFIVKLIFGKIGRKVLIIKLYPTYFFAKQYLFGFKMQ
jgi:hypothetical protein